MTRENWPLIGPMATKGAYVAGALSGYGTMGACATGALVAAWVLGETLPDFARSLSLARYDDKALMQGLLSAASTGVLSASLSCAHGPPRFAGEDTGGGRRPTRRWPVSDQN